MEIYRALQQSQGKLTLSFLLFSSSYFPFIHPSIHLYQSIIIYHYLAIHHYPIIHSYLSSHQSTCIYLNPCIYIQPSISKISYRWIFSYPSLFNHFFPRYPWIVVSHRSYGCPWTFTEEQTAYMVLGHTVSYVRRHLENTVLWIPNM